MKKRIFFENRADAQKEANSIHTYVNFVYDTKTKKLQLVDSFGGEEKVYDITLTEAASDEGQGGETPEP